MSCIVFEVNAMNVKVLLSGHRSNSASVRYTTGNFRKSAEASIVVEWFSLKSDLIAAIRKWSNTVRW